MTTQTSRKSEAPDAPDAPDALGAVLREYMDVTQRLQATHETLEREMVRLRKELESKDRELERRRRLASLGELAAGIAHEVRNPLGAIQLYSGLLRQKCSSIDSAVGLIEKIEAGIRAIDEVVQDTLALAPRDGRSNPQLVRRVVEGARDVSLSTLQALGVALAVRYERDDLCVGGDLGALQRVLVILIVNAAEASQSGQTVTVSAVAGSGADASMVRIHVSDEGVGLAQGVIDEIFDPFFTTKQAGTGLGLTIAHRLVEAHGGRLTAQNRPEGGAEFVVALPAANNGVEAELEPDTECTSAA